MKKVIVALITSVAVLFGGLALATPAQATKGDYRTCVTNKEYRAITNGMPKAKAVRILDGKGTKINKRVRQYETCGKSSKVVRVKYKKPFPRGGNKVVRKWRVTPPVTVNPSSMSYAEYQQIKPGMTLAQVKNIVGGVGRVTSESYWYGDVETRREWNTTGCKYGFAAVYLTNDIVDSGYAKFWGGC